MYRLLAVLPLILIPAPLVFLPNFRRLAKHDNEFLVSHIELGTVSTLVPLVYSDERAVLEKTHEVYAAAGGLSGLKSLWSQAELYAAMGYKAYLNHEISSEDMREIRSGARGFRVRALISLPEAAICHFRHDLPRYYYNSACSAYVRLALRTTTICCDEGTACCTLGLAERL